MAGLNPRNPNSHSTHNFKMESSELADIMKRTQSVRRG